MGIEGALVSLQRQRVPDGESDEGKEFGRIHTYHCQ